MCVGSLAELGELAGQDLSDAGPAPPYVDDVTFALPGRARPTARRVPEVIDAWYDSGSMPFAQWGYPHAPGSDEQFEQAYPAQFICEAIDQTRGWFYTLMAVGTLVFGRSSYENVLCLGHILAEDGRKMSKHLGNILRADPADGRPRRRRPALVHGRQRLAVAAAPGRARGAAGDRPQDAADLLEHGVLPHALRRRQRLVAAGDAGARRAPSGRCWTGGRCPRPTGWCARSTAASRRSTPRGPGALLAEFVDDLSNWYVRRSRRRFWDGDPAALATLHECLRRR